jgi:hypothetical protein
LIITILFIILHYYFLFLFRFFWFEGKPESHMTCLPPRYDNVMSQGRQSSCARVHKDALSLFATPQSFMDVHHDIFDECEKSSLTGHGSLKYSFFVTVNIALLKFIVRISSLDVSRKFPFPHFSSQSVKAVFFCHHSLR